MSESQQNPRGITREDVPANKRKAADLAISMIEKEYGKGAIMKMGDSAHLQVETIPSGSISLDLALGGGIPRGRVTEIYGPESSGKTTLASHIVAEAQRRGGLAAFIDAEHAFDPDYARRLGVDIENLLMSQPDNGEQALEIAETLIRSNAVDVIVIDSVAALVPKGEIEGDMEDMQPGMQARLMSKALRKITSAIAKSKCAVIFINQLRMKIGVMFGNPETTPGGNALKFYASVRLDIRRTDKIEEGSGDARQVIGNHVRVKVVKNKVAPPFRLAEFDILYNRGISTEGDVLDTAVKLDLIKKTGNFYAVGSTKMGPGREAARAHLCATPELVKSLTEQIHAKSKELVAAGLVPHADAMQDKDE